MTISFTCPHCGVQTDVYEEYAGQSGPCAVCGKTVTVPYVPGRSAAPARPGPAPHIGAARAGSRSPLLLIVGIILGGAAALACLLVVLFTLVFPAVAAARSAARKTHCAKNLERIALAMLEYESQHGCLPPAYIPDDKGKPLHSWRVLLLPQLGYRHLYQQYDFSQPWNSPRNTLLARQMPPEYACPADPDAATLNEANYQVIVGDATAFPGARAVKLLEITDGAADTLLVVETPSSGVNWMDPKDLTIRQMRFALNSKPGVEIGSRHRGGAHVATADGKVHFLTADTAPEIIRGLSTRQGGETVPWFPDE